MFKVTIIQALVATIVDPKNKGREIHRVLKSAFEGKCWVISENLERNSDTADLVTDKEVRHMFGDTAYKKLRLALGLS